MGDNLDSSGRGNASAQGSSEGSKAETLQAQKDRRAQAGLWLRAAVRPAAPFVRLAALCGTLNGALIVGQYFCLALIVHGLVIENQPLAAQAGPAVLLVAAVLARALCVFGQERLGIMGAHRVERRVRDRVMRHICDSGPSFVQRHDAGSLTTAATDQVEALEGYVARYLPQSFMALTVPLLIILAVAPVNWVIAALFLLTWPMAPLFMGLIGMGAASASARQFEELARLGGHFIDRLRGLTTLKLFGQARIEADAMEKVAEAYRLRTMKVLRIAFLSSGVLEFFSTLAIAVAAIYIGLGLLGFIDFGPAGGITLFEGLFVLLLAPEFFQPLRQLGTFYHDRASAIGAAEKLMALVPPDEDSEEDDRLSPGYTGIAEAPALRFDGVALTFPDGRRALKQVSFEIRAGKSVALMGPSGSGKSSIVNILLGFEAPSAGHVIVDGMTMEARHLAAAREATAWVGQRTHLFRGTIAENIRMGHMSATREQIEDAARAAHVLEFTRELPHGLDTPVGERGFGLSGGQAQRVALARAFLKDAPLVLLDEPTATLDRENETLILDSIRRLARGRTVILCTHSNRAAAICDTVLTIRDGEIVSTGESISSLVIDTPPARGGTFSRGETV